MLFRRVTAEEALVCLRPSFGALVDVVKDHANDEEGHERRKDDHD
jgi:hypothetical protein